MIRLHRLLYSFVCCGIAATIISSCANDDDLSSTSIFENDIAKPAVKSDFDKWLDTHYVKNYNIDLKYRLDDIQTDFTYNLIPADEQKSIRMAHAILYGWLQAYDEVAGIDFTRSYAPKIIHLIGSYPWDRKGSIKLGTAEDGLKVTFYNINNFKVTADSLSEYFQIMHHEFTHILTHNKDYDVAFRAISDTSYVNGGWPAFREEEALQRGFINNYAMKEYHEDFAEMLSFYLVFTQEYWDRQMNRAGDTGKPILQKKLDMVRTYMLSAWGVDIDVLRTVLHRRVNEIASGKVDLEDLSLSEN